MAKKSGPRRKTKHLRRMKIYTKAGLFLLVALTLLLCGMKLAGVIG